jgi:hypothetical protein
MCQVPLQLQQKNFNYKGNQLTRLYKFVTSLEINIAFMN